MQVFKKLYDADVKPEDFIPYMGMGEAYFLGGVAKDIGVEFDADVAKQTFFDVYINNYAVEGAGISYPGRIHFGLDIGTTCLTSSYSLVVLSI